MFEVSDIIQLFEEPGTQKPLVVALVGGPYSMTSIWFVKQVPERPERSRCKLRPNVPPASGLGLAGYLDPQG